MPKTNESSSASRNWTGSAATKSKKFAIKREELKNLVLRPSAARTPRVAQRQAEARSRRVGDSIATKWRETRFEISKARGELAAQEALLDNVTRPTCPRWKSIMLVQDRSRGETALHRTGLEEDRSDLQRGRGKEGANNPYAESLQRRSRKAAEQVQSSG